MEVARTHALPIESLWLGWSSHGRLPWPHHGDRVEGTIPLHYLTIAAERYGDARALRVVVRDHHDLAGMWIRQRLEQNGVHHTEDRRAGADAQRQGERSNNGEPH